MFPPSNQSTILFPTTLYIKPFEKSKTLKKLSTNVHIPNPTIIVIPWFPNYPTTLFLVIPEGDLNVPSVVTYVIKNMIVPLLPLYYIQYHSLLSTS